MKKELQFTEIISKPRPIKKVAKVHKKQNKVLSRIGWIVFTIGTVFAFYVLAVCLFA